MRELDRVRPDTPPAGRPSARRANAGTAADARARPPDARARGAAEQSVGNRAVTQLLQREPKTAPAADPPVDEVLDAYFELLVDVASSNQKSVTGFRRDFMRDLKAELGGQYQAFAEAQAAGNSPRRRR